MNKGYAAYSVRCRHGFLEYLLLGIRPSRSAVDALLRAGTVKGSEPKAVRIGGRKRRLK
jgi:hypothetical protein